MFFLFSTAIVGLAACECDGKLTLKKAAGCKEIEGTLLVSEVPDFNLRITGTTSLSKPQQSKSEGKEIDVASVALEVSHNMEIKAIEFESIREISGDVHIFDNPMLRSVSFPEFESFTGRLLMTANAIVRDRTIETNTSGINNMTKGNGPHFLAPSLKSAEGNLSFYDVGYIDMKTLENIKGDLRIQNTALLQLSLPELSSLSGTGTIAIRNNTELTQLSFPLLKSLSGSVIITGNPNWKVTDETFPKLEKDSGSFWMQINQTSDKIELRLSSLKNVRGVMRLEIESANAKAICAEFKKKYKDSGIVEGAFVCTQGTGTSNSSNLARSVILLLLCTIVALAA